MKANGWWTKEENKKRPLSIWHPVRAVRPSKDWATSRVEVVDGWKTSLNDPFRPRKVQKAGKSSRVQPSSEYNMIFIYIYIFIWFHSVFKFQWIFARAQNLHCDGHNERLAFGSLSSRFGFQMLHQIVLHLVMLSLGEPYFTSKLSLVWPLDRNSQCWTNGWHYASMNSQLRRNCRHFWIISLGTFQLFNPKWRVETGWNRFKHEKPHVFYNI